MSTKAIVLLSGGMDSLALIPLAKDEGHEIFTLHLQYGQKTQDAELKAFHAINAFYRIPSTHQLVIQLSLLSQIKGSALTDSSMSTHRSQQGAQSIPLTYVPFRNAHILSTAISWAEVIAADVVFIGANEEDSPGYPDCREAFYQAFQSVIVQGTREGKCVLKTPVIHMKKKEIVQYLMKARAPVELSWSCYEGPLQPCGVCESCFLRQRGFEEAGFKDPAQQ